MCKCDTIVLCVSTELIDMSIHYDQIAYIFMLWYNKVKELLQEK